MAVVGGMGKTSSKKTSFIKGANAGPVQGKLNPMRVRCLLTKKRKEKKGGTLDLPSKRRAQQK